MQRAVAGGQILHARVTVRGRRVEARPAGRDARARLAEITGLAPGAALELLVQPAPPDGDCLFHCLARAADSTAAAARETLGPAHGWGDGSTISAFAALANCTVVVVMPAADGAGFLEVFAAGPRPAPPVFLLFRNHHFDGLLPLAAAAPPARGSPPHHRPNAGHAHRIV